jgi:hypothetical protein
MQTTVRPLAWPFGLLAVFAALASSSADEAWRTDGRHLVGTLKLDGGQLHFQPTDGAALAQTECKRFRLADRTPPPFRAGAGRRVILRDGQRITGQIIALSKETLSLRTGWAARLELPRAAVAAIDSLPGWRTVVDEDFHAGLKAFTTAGEPTVIEADAQREGRAVLLRAIGQKVTYALKQPLSAGRVGVNFAEQGQTSGARWDLELWFGQGQRARRMTISVAGDDESYTVETAPLEGTARKVKRTPGPHRLLVQFAPRRLRVTCDEDVLWYNLDEGPGQPLAQVTMACQRLPDGETVRGGVAWSEFGIERAVVEHPRPPVDPAQDEVRLLEDDQLFGRILQADRHTLQIEGRFGKRTLAWTQLSGCSFRRSERSTKENTTAKVRLLVRSGLCPEEDVLEGDILALDERRLVLRHALLGEVTLQRGWVRELRPLPDDAK